MPPGSRKNIKMFLKNMNMFLKKMNMFFPKHSHVSGDSANGIRQLVLS